MCDKDVVKKISYDSEVIDQVRVNNHLITSNSIPNNGGRNIVVWSGGCDSTALLYEICSLNPDTVTYAISIDSYFLDRNKVKAETESREKILERLRSLGCRISHMIVKIDHDGDWIDVKSAGLPQAYLWANYVLPNLGDHDNLILGYIKGDDFWHYSETYKKMIKYGSELLLIDINVVTPYEWIEKWEILRLLQSNGLYDLTWYCEMTKNGVYPCMNCAPCQHHFMALLQWMSNTNKDDHETRQWITNRINQLQSFRDNPDGLIDGSGI